MKKRLLPYAILPVLLALALGTAYAAAPSQIQVRVVTGAEELSAGSQLELRIYEAGDKVLKFPLAHGESWPRDSTRVIPLTVNDAFDARTVLRFALYYHAASPLTPPLEVVAADVDLTPGRDPGVRLLDTTLSGVIARQGELASEERESSAIACRSDADCDDHRSCNGHERCAPRTAGADARGCVKGWPVVCPVNQVCSEGHGCRGSDVPTTRAPPVKPAAAAAPADASTAADPAADATGAAAAK